MHRHAGVDDAAQHAAEGSDDGSAVDVGDDRAFLHRVADGSMGMDVAAGRRAQHPRPLVASHLAGRLRVRLGPALPNHAAQVVAAAMRLDTVLEVQRLLRREMDRKFPELANVMVKTKERE